MGQGASRTAGPCQGLQNIQERTTSPRSPATATSLQAKASPGWKRKSCSSSGQNSPDFLKMLLLSSQFFILPEI